MGIPVGNPNALVRPKMQKTGGKQKKTSNLFRLRTNDKIKKSPKM